MLLHDTNIRRKCRHSNAAGLSRTPEWLIERQIVLALERRGALVVKIPNEALWKRRVRHTLRGFPDLIAILPGGQVVFFEVKTQRGRPTRYQEDTHARIRELGHRVYVVRSPEEAIKALEYGSGGA